MNLTLPVSGAWRTTAIDLGQWLPGGSADGRNRRTAAAHGQAETLLERPVFGAKRPWSKARRIGGSRGRDVAIERRR